MCTLFWAEKKNQKDAFTHKYSKCFPSAMVVHFFLDPNPGTFSAVPTTYVSPSAVLLHPTHKEPAGFLHALLRYIIYIFGFPCFLELFCWWDRPLDLF